MKAQVGAQPLRAETQSGPAPTGALACGRKEKSGVDRLSPDPDECFVDIGMARTTIGPTIPFAAERSPGDRATGRSRFTQADAVAVR